MRLHMTVDEIKISYRDSRNKLSQVSILAQLNACSEEVICHTLEIDYTSIMVGKTEARRKAEQARSELCWELYNAGVSDREMARQLEISRYTVELWRQEKSLPPNKQQHSNLAYLPSC